MKTAWTLARPWTLTSATPPAVNASYPAAVLLASYRDALLVLTHERVPLQWAMSTGNQGVAMKLLAGRSGDAEIAKLAVQQLKAASTTLRDNGDAPSAAYYEAQLNAPVVADRVTVLRRTQKAARHHRIVN